MSGFGSTPQRSRGSAGSGSRASSSEGAAGAGQGPGLRAAMMAAAAAGAAGAAGKQRKEQDGRFRSEGQSESWNSQKKSVVKMFNQKFRQSSEARIQTYTADFDDLPQSVACDSDTYDDFAWWMANEYIIASGEYKGDSLSCDTVLNYMNILVNSACARFAVSDDVAVK